MIKEIIIIALVLNTISMYAQINCDTIFEVKTQIHNYKSPKFSKGDTTIISLLLQEVSPCLNELLKDDSLERFIDVSFMINKNGTINNKKFSIESSSIYIKCMKSKKETLIKNLNNWEPAILDGKRVTSIISITIWKTKTNFSLSVKDNRTHKKIVTWEQ